MKKMILALAGAAATFAIPGSAIAQADSMSPATRALANQLGACMARKTTGEDRIAFAGWMLAAMASSPDLADVARVNPARKDQLDRKVGALFTRLMTQDCLTEAKALFATRDPAAFKVAGEPLGRVAMTELLSKPEFNASLGAFVKYVDEDKMKQLMN